LTVPTIEQAQELGVFDETFAREYAELFYQYSEAQIVDVSAFEHAFNLHAMPLDEAIHTTVRWYREHTGA
jgi:nucleoside-diphosphate-sugar epimerase